MIAFHGDFLVPRELCRLLYLTVPEELHVPVVFHNRPTPLIGQRVLAICTGDQIHVNLNKVYNAALWKGSPGALTVCVWRSLLDICYHEFGHVATQDQFEAVGDAYRSYRGFRYIEGLADDWKDQRMAILLEHDGRLAQPRVLTGYLGLRVWRHLDYWHKNWHKDWEGHREVSPTAGSVRASFVTEVRCRRTGGQLSAGEALEYIGLSRTAYRELRSASADIGIDYTDSAGRRHKLYTWGDLPVLAEALKGSSPTDVRWRLFKNVR